MGRPVAPRGEGRSRLLEAALTLFAQHGVNGTSLQMIADSLGVTKAAVYHLFNSKSEIVLAVAAPALAQMEHVTAEAEKGSDAQERFELALAGLVDLVLDNRLFSAAMQRDPQVGRELEEATEFRSLASRIDVLLIGAEPSSEARAALALAGGGLLVSAVNPSLEGIPRETLRGVFIESTTRVLGPYRQ